MNESVPRIEPKYIGPPSYCVLRFGPAPQSVVWLALDDDHIYVDRRASGDLADADACVPLPAMRYGVPIDLGHVLPADARESVRLKLHQFQFAGERTIYLHAWFADGKREGASPVWNHSPQSAPIVHFYGPLTFELTDRSLRLARSEPTKLEVMLGRPGIGPRAFAWRNHSDIPRQLHPLARIRIPMGAPGWTAQFSLDQRCCGCRFHTILRLGDELSHGPAEIEVTFDDWASEKVVPARFSVPFVHRIPDG